MDDGMERVCSASLVGPYYLLNLHIHLSLSTQPPNVTGYQCFDTHLNETNRKFEIKNKI